MCNVSKGNYKIKQIIFSIICMFYVVSLLTIDFGVSSEGNIIDLNIPEHLGNQITELSDHVIINRTPTIETSRVFLNPLDDNLKQNGFEEIQLKIIMDYYFIPLIQQLWQTILTKKSHVINIIVLIITYSLEWLIIFIQNNDGKKRYISSYSY